VRRRLIGCRALLDLSFEDPRGLADRSRHIGQPFGAEQQHHHGEQDEEVPAGQACHDCPWVKANVAHA
jgi:hypothetical protein